MNLSAVAAVRHAGERYGLYTQDAAVIHEANNTIVLLSAEQLVAKVITGPDSIERADRVHELTGWLVGQGFPTTAPYPAGRPLAVEDSAVSFWRYYRQPEGSLPTSQHLGHLLRWLHRLPTPPIELPQWIPLESLHATLTYTACAAITLEERDWLFARISATREELAGLDSKLGIGPIHGDGWAGNLLWDTSTQPTRALLMDWDYASVGPREVDLIPTWHATVRYGRTLEWTRQFTAAYGYDLAAWSGYDALLRMRDLVQLTGPLRHADHSVVHAGRLRQRLDAIRAGDHSSQWSMQH